MPRPSGIAPASALDPSPKGTAPIRAAVSHAEDESAVVRELAAEIDPRRTSFLLVFPHDGLDPDALAAALRAELSGIPVFGCTTAGQITPAGYESSACLALIFDRAHFRCASLLVDPLAPVSMGAILAQARRLDARFPRSAHWRRLGLTFTDGLSLQEDMLAAALAAALPEIPIFGGSAGDGLSFRETRVLHGGAFHRNAALLLLVETDLDFVGLGFDHFNPTDCRMVVTRAVPEARLVLELNGSPAAAEYARLVGCPVEALSPRVFAENPVLVRNNAVYHVRAIQSVAEDGALSFLSAIDDGLPLVLGRSADILETLAGALAVRDVAGRAPDFVLGFDCVLRRLEIEAKGLSAAASRILAEGRVTGFNTYGEQHYGLHVNQTFVGVAFFAPAARAAA